MVLPESPSIGGGSIGPAGPAGPGLPTGGLAGQAAYKLSGTDHDTGWANPYGKGVVVVPGVPSGSDDTAVLQASLNTVPDNGVWCIPADGTWRTTGLEWEGTGINIAGFGRSVGYLQHIPTADGQKCLSVKNTGGVQALNCRFSNLGITTVDSTHDKTGLYLEDMGQCVLDNVNVTGFGGAGTDSVGVHTRGRQNLWASNLRVSANIPLRIGTNPNTTLGYLSADHFNFLGCYFTAMDAPATLTRAVVLIDGTAHVSQLQFRGGAWLLGGAVCHGLHWSMGADVQAYSSGLLIDSVRTEGNEYGAGAYSVYINARQQTPLRNLTISNCELDIFHSGYYCRYVDLIDVRSTIIGHRTAQAPIPFDVDNMRAMSWDRVWTFADCKAGTMGASYSLIDQTAEAVSYTYPHSGVWGAI